MPAARAEQRLALWLAVAVLISTIDRGNLATAGPLIRDDLHLSATAFGILISCFYWTYTACMGPVTWLAHRFGPRPVLALSVAVWSMATGLTGLAGGIWMLLALRLVLGAAESGVSPCAWMLISSDISAGRRGRANGLLAVAFALGPAFGTFAGGLLMSWVGWRPVFALLGVASLLWLWPWLRFQSASTAATHSEPRGDPIPLSALLRERALWGTTLANVCGTYTYVFMISWMPTYLVQVRGLSMAQMAQTIGAAYLLRAATSFASGQLIDRSLVAGRSATLVYKLLIGAMGAAVTASIFGIATASQRGFVAWIFFYEMFAGLGTTAGFAAVQTLAGPRAIGQWVSAQNIAGSLAGIVAPALTGLIIDWTGSFRGAFFFAGGVAVTNLVAWLVVVPRVVPVKWSADDASG